MPAMNIPSSKLAEIALSVMNEASVKSDDHTLALVTGARSMLHQIVSGQLIVIPAPVAAPAGGPAAGSDGVIPAQRAGT